MYTFLQKHKKKLMVFFGVGLMIVFILPAGVGQVTGPGKVRLGVLNGETLRVEDIQAARFAWDDMLGLFVLNPQTQQYQPVVSLLFRGPSDDALRSIESNPEAAYLFLRELGELGIRPDVESAAQIVNDVNSPIVARVPGENRLVELNSPALSNANRTRYIRALANAMALSQAYERHGNPMKIPVSIGRSELAMRGQQIRVAIAELPVLSDLNPSAPIDDARILAHFNQLADKAPGQPTADNPLGSGYRVPDGVKLQYVQVDRDAVREIVRASKTDYEWDLLAYPYYQNNPRQFPGTQPARPEESPDDFNLGPRQQPTPTTAPYEDVREVALDAVLRPEVDRMLSSIANRIATRMQTDFQTWRAAVEGDRPAPESSLKVPYDSHEYLEQLASTVEREFKVRPRIVSLRADFMTRQQIDQDPLLGNAFAGEAMQRGMTFAPEMIFDESRALVPARTSGLLKWEPSPVLRVPAGSRVILRVTDARPAAKATTLTDELRERVAQDLRTLDAIERTKTSAKSALQSLEHRDLQTVWPRAVKTEWFRPALPPREVQVAGQAYVQFRDGMIELLRVAGEAGGMSALPVETVITLPADAPTGSSLLSPWEQLRAGMAGRAPRLLLVQLLDAKADWTDDTNRQFIEIALVESMEQSIATVSLEPGNPFAPSVNRLASAWFSFDGVAQRSGYKPDRPGAE